MPKKSVKFPTMDSAKRKPKRTQKPPPKEKKLTLEEEKAPLQVSEDQEKKPFDFGGLPDRNLKKNLGCG